MTVERTVQRCRNESTVLGPSGLPVSRNVFRTTCLISAFSGVRVVVIGAYTPSSSTICWYSELILVYKRQFVPSLDC